MKQKLLTALGIIGISLLLLVPSVYYGLKEAKLPKQTISIHQYNSTKSFGEYMAYQSFVKDLIINDLVNGKGLDSNLVTKVEWHLDMTVFTDSMNMPLFAHKGSLRDRFNKISVRPTNDSISFTLDSLGANYYESLAYMNMNRKQDSTWVKNSDTYNRFVKDIVDKLRHTNGIRIVTIDSTLIDKMK